jgi:hypothetical protein
MQQVSHLHSAPWAEESRWCNSVKADTRNKDTFDLATRRFLTTHAGSGLEAVECDRAVGSIEGWVDLCHSAGDSITRPSTITHALQERAPEDILMMIAYALVLSYLLVLTVCSLLVAAPILAQQ